MSNKWEYHSRFVRSNRLIHREEKGKQTNGAPDRKQDDSKAGKTGKVGKATLEATQTQMLRNGRC